MVAATLLILGAGFLGSQFLMTHGPEAPKSEREIELVTVEVIAVQKVDVAIQLRSEGVVSVRRESALSAEVGGKVVEMSEEFVRGGTFEKDDLILKLEGADYQALLANAESALAEARLALRTEEARGEQAARDWQKLGRGGEPSAMILRQPHMASARARVAAAEANVVKAERDLARTEIRAPYDCRVRGVSVGLGAILSPGMSVGEIFEIENYELRLPFSLEDEAYLKMDGEVTLRARVGGRELSWPGEILRDEGEVNRETLSTYLYVRPGKNENAPEGFKTPPPGLFVQASLTGEILADVVELPREAMLSQNQVLVVDAEDRLRFRKVEVIRREAEVLYVRAELEKGERVCVTKVEFPIEGMKVAVVKTSAETDAESRENPAQTPNEKR